MANCHNRTIVNTLPQFVCCLAAACLLAGCADYGILPDDGAEIAALKKAGAIVMPVPLNPKLIAVNLNDKGIGDSVMANFEKLSNVTSVDLKNCKVTDAGLAHLKPTAANLLALNLQNNTAITDASLEMLKNSPNMQALNLNYTDISDAGLQNLSGMTKLETLQLYGCKKVTDAGLEHLKGLQSMNTLVLTGTGVTKEGADKLKKVAKKIDLYQGP